MAKATFNFIFDLFLERSLPPVYENLIENTATSQVLRAGLDSSLLKGTPTMLLVKNIPDYLKPKVQTAYQTLHMAELTQYKGYLINLSGFADSAEYISTQLSSRNRKNLRSKMRKLEEDHQVSYTFYHGEITRTEYDRLFDVFYALLVKRFHEKKLFNIYLDQWKYYYDRVYPMIVNKEASLAVIYDGDKPITLTLNFHVDRCVYSLIQAYDTDYSPYNLGDISNLKHLDWCFEHGVLIFDLLMGETYNKVKWANQQYAMRFQLFYDPDKVGSLLAFHWTKAKLRLKQFLRDKNIIGNKIQLDKIYYYTKMRHRKNHQWKG